MAPFVVFSLPRSRSTWLSVLLGAPDAPVGHDLGIECFTSADFVRKIREDYAGTCETGAGFAWRLIRAEIPDARFVVIRRPVAEVCASLAEFGIYDVEDEMRARNSYLDEIAAQPGTRSVDYSDLGDMDACWKLYEHCHGAHMFPFAWWRQIKDLNIQVDVAEQISRTSRNRAQIAALKAEVAERLAHA